MRKSVMITKILVFTVIFSVGLWFLYLINFIWVVSVLVLLGIGLGVSGIPSQRIAPYPSDAAVLFVQRIKRFLSK